MELKRFVLLSDNTIVDVSKEKYYLTQTGLIRYRENAIIQVTQMGTVKSTSDNILDLIEVGDLIGIEVTPNSQITTSGYDGLEIRQLHLPITFHEKHALYNGGAVLKSEIKAIYKRQSNGDYKRYEVKE